MSDFFDQVWIDVVDRLQGMLAEIITFLPSLLAGLLVGIVSIVIARTLRKRLQRTVARSTLPASARALLENSLWIISIAIVITVTLAAMGVNVFGLVAGLGIGGLVIGFALKDIIENSLAGALILLQRPFYLGDYVEVDGYAGNITDIELRAMTIKTLDGTEVVIPNRTVYISSVENFSRYTLRRRKIEVLLDDEADVRAILDDLMAVLRGVEGVAEDPAPVVMLDNFGNSGIQGGLYYYLDTATHGYAEVHNEALLALQEAARRLNVRLTLPPTVLLDDDPANEA